MDKPTDTATPITADIKKALPNYTRAEEIFNMVTHIVGGGLGLVALLACVIVAAYNHNVWGIVSGGVYGITVILLFTTSSVYHGLKVSPPKRVMRIVDHCTISVLIAGTYTPVALSNFRVEYPLDAWLIFSLIWALAALVVVLNAVNMHRFRKLSMVCYLGMGWMMIFRIQRLIAVLGRSFFVFILAGGALYTIGVAFYIAGKKKKFMHSVFHLFVNVASILHSVGIAVYIMPH